VVKVIIIILSGTPSIDLKKTCITASPCRTILFLVPTICYQVRALLFTSAGNCQSSGENDLEQYHKKNLKFCCVNSQEKKVMKKKWANVVSNSGGLDQNVK